MCHVKQMFTPSLTTISLLLLSLPCFQARKCVDLVENCYGLCYNYPTEVALIYFDKEDDVSDNVVKCLESCSKVHQLCDNNDSCAFSTSDILMLKLGNQYYML